MEDLENKDNLTKIYEIIKIMGNYSLHSLTVLIQLIVFTDDSGFLELLLSDSFYLLVFGAFECK